VTHRLTTRAPARPAPSTGRIAGVDVARAAALVGMFAAHILPLNTADGGSTPVGLVVDGKSSALFAVLAGVGIALGTGGTRRPPDAAAHRAVAAGLLVRGALVALVGLALVGVDPPVAVILAYYGLLFVMAAPLVRLPAWALAAGAVLACGLAPVLSHGLRSGLPRGPGEQPDLGALTEQPLDLLVTLGLTGYYPALPWITYLLAGMALGRIDLRSARTAVALVAGGTALATAAAGVSALLLGPGGGTAAIGRFALQSRRYGTTPTDTWWWLAVDAPHSGTPLDLAHTTGTALAVLGVALLLARWARPLAWVPAAVGSVPLTLYTTHVLVLAAVEGYDDGVSLLAWNVAGAVVVGVALRLAGTRGPLEAVVSRAGTSARRAFAAPPRAAGPPGAPGAGTAQ
jgi:uncharacterized membrane protein